MACNQNKDNKIHAKFTLLAVSSERWISLKADRTDSQTPHSHSKSHSRGQPLAWPQPAMLIHELPVASGDVRADNHGLNHDLNDSHG